MNVVIVGAGEIGSQVARFLTEEGQKVVVIERDPAKVRELQSGIDAGLVEGDGTDPRVLERAGVANANLILSVTDSDIVNILTCNIASVLAPEAIRLARIRNDAYARDARILTKNGIDIVINPEQLVVEKILNLVTFRHCIDYVEFEEGRAAVIAFRMKDGHPLTGIQLKDVRHHLPSPAYLITMIIRDGSAIIPGGDTDIREDDRVYFMVRKGDILSLMMGLGYPTDPVPHVFIYGADYLAVELARRLEARPGLSVKIAHPDMERCDRLATDLSRSLVLHGDPADDALLDEENVDAQTVFVAAERDEERNLLAAVLAHSRSSAPRVIGVTHRTSYIQLLSAIGLDVVLCPLNIAVSSIVQYLRKGAVVQMGPIETRDATAIEFVAGERLHDKRIQDLGLPRHVLIGAVLRDDDVIIPTGSTVIEPYDRLIVFTSRAHYALLDRHFSVQARR